MKTFKLFFMVGIFFLSAQLRAQYDMVITPSGGTVLGIRRYFDGSSLTGGDLVGLEAGSGPFNERVVFTNFLGNPGNPLRLENKDGQAVFKKGVEFWHSSNFVFSGDGSGHSGSYGIYIEDGVNDSGKQPALEIIHRSSDFEIEYLDVMNTSGFACIQAKDDDVMRSSGWVMQNCYFHHNYLHDTVEGEGFYIGSSFYDSGSDHLLRNIYIYSNLVSNVSWDGIQVGSSTNNTYIYDNVLIDYASHNVFNQSHGILFNTGTRGDVYNNLVIGHSGNTSGNGIEIQGLGYTRVYNNIIVDSGQYGMYRHAGGGSPIPGAWVYWVNNTIINPNGSAFRINQNVNSTNNYFINNICYKPDGDEILGMDNVLDYVVDFGENLITNTLYDYNIFTNDLAWIGFADPAGWDYSLLTNSPAVNSGLDVRAWGIGFDYAYYTRPVSFAYDMGAYEYPFPLTAAITNPDRTWLTNSSVTFSGYAADTTSNVEAVYLSTDGSGFFAADSFTVSRVTSWQHQLDLSILGEPDGSEITLYVFAVNSFGEHSSTNSRSYFIDLLPPDLTAVYYSDTMTDLSWQRIRDITNYSIYASTNGPIDLDNLYQAVLLTNNWSQPGPSFDFRHVLCDYPETAGPYKGWYYAVGTNAGSGGSWLSLENNNLNYGYWEMNYDSGLSEFDLSWADSIIIYLKNLSSPDIPWNMQLVLNDGSSRKESMYDLSNYTTISDSLWTRLVIPRADIEDTGKNWQQIKGIGFDADGGYMGYSNYTFALDEIIFSGSGTNFTWYGDLNDSGHSFSGNLTHSLIPGPGGAVMPGLLAPGFNSLTYAVSNRCSLDSPVLTIEEPTVLWLTQTLTVFSGTAEDGADSMSDITAVYYSLDGVSFNPVDSYSVQFSTPWSQSLNLSSLAEGSSNTFYAYAINSFGDHSLTNEYTFMVDILPPALTAVKIAASETGLSWNQFRDITVHSIYASTNGPIDDSSLGQAVLLTNSAIGFSYTHFLCDNLLTSGAEKGWFYAVGTNGGSGGSYLQVSNAGIGYGYSQLFYDSGQTEVDLSDSDHIILYIRNISEAVMPWQGLQLRINDGGSIAECINPLSYYAQYSDSAWCRVMIPRSDFPLTGPGWSRIKGVGFDADGGYMGYSNYCFGLDEMRFGGGSSSFTWYGDTRDGLFSSDGSFTWQNSSGTDGAVEPGRIIPGYNSTLYSVTNGCSAPPAISILSHSNNDAPQWITGLMNVSGTASDGQFPITNIQYQYEGEGSWHNAAGIHNWSFSFDPSSRQGMTNVLVIRAQDAGGTSVSAVLTNRIDLSPPFLFMLDLTNGSTLQNGTVTGLAVEDAINSLVNLVLKISNAGTVYQSIDVLPFLSGSNWNTMLDISSFSNGSYSMVLEGLNQAGLANMLTLTDLVISKGTGRILLDSPLSAGPYSGSVLLQGHVEAGDSPMGELFMSNRLSGGWQPLAAVSSNWQYDWNTTLFTDGPVDLYFSYTNVLGEREGYTNFAFIADNSPGRAFETNVGPQSAVKGVVTFAGTNYDNYSAVTANVLLLDGAVSAFCGTSPWLFSIDTGLLPNGPAVFSIAVSNETGLVSTNAWTNYVSNGFFQVQSPVQDEYLQGDASLAGLVVDPLSVSVEVFVSIDGQPAAPAGLSGTSWTSNFDTTGLTDGPHIFSFYYLDDTGNTNGLTDVDVVVDNSPPEVSIDYLGWDSDGELLYGFSGICRDDDSGISVSLLMISNHRNGSLLAVDSVLAADWQRSLDLGYLPGGSYSMYIIATNNTGLGSVSVSQVIEVLDEAFNPLAGPNPCNRTAGVSELQIFDVTASTEVRIYTIGGVLLRVLGAEETRQNGSKLAMYWDLKNHAGHEVGGGTYILEIRDSESGESVNQKVTVKGSVGDFSF